MKIKRDDIYWLDLFQDTNTMDKHNLFHYYYYENHRNIEYILFHSNMLIDYNNDNDH